MLKTYQIKRENPFLGLFDESIVKKLLNNVNNYCFYEKTEFGLETNITKDVEKIMRSIKGEIKNKLKKNKHIEKRLINSSIINQIIDENIDVNISGASIDIKSDISPKNKIQTKQDLFFSLNNYYGKKTIVFISQAKKDNLTCVNSNPEINNESIVLIDIKANNIINFNQIIIHVDKNTDVTVLINDNQGLQSSQFLHQIIKFDCGENSHTKIYELNEFNGLKINNKIINLSDNSSLDISQFNFKTKLLIDSNQISLSGCNSNISIKSLNLEKNKETFVIQNEINHLAKDSSSNVYVKSLLNKSSKIIALNNLLINENIINTKALQKGDVMLLDNNSEANIFPYLNINDKETTTMHSVRVSPVDNSKINYLMTRGLTKEQAYSLIINGFVSDIFNGISLLNTKKKDNHVKNIQTQKEKHESLRYINKNKNNQLDNHYHFENYDNKNHTVGNKINTTIKKTYEKVMNYLSEYINS